jgi:hypothetical protein
VRPSDPAADNRRMTELVAPQLQFFADLAVRVDKPQEVGRTARGLRRLIPILGGEASGDGWLDARYCLETDAGELIYVQNRAIRSGPPELMARLVRGEPVDPSRIYFRCSPSFETASPSLQWITERMFVGAGARHPDQVVMRFWQLA